MFPILSTKFVIANVADRSSRDGTKQYIEVAFFDEHGRGHNFWFPSEFKDFATSHLHKEVTADVQFWYANGRTSLIGRKLY